MNQALQVACFFKMQKLISCDTAPRKCWLLMDSLLPHGRTCLGMIIPILLSYYLGCNDFIMGVIALHRLFGHKKLCPMLNGWQLCTGDLCKRYMATRYMYHRVLQMVHHKSPHVTQFATSVKRCTPHTILIINLLESSAQGHTTKSPHGTSI